MPKTRDDFYVGYIPKMPGKLATFLTRIIIGLLILVPLLASLVVGQQSGYAPAIYAFGEVREFDGVILERPYPMLAITRPGKTEGLSAQSMYYLVGPAKSGVASQFTGLNGTHARLKGTLLYRDDQTMIEVLPGSLETAGPRPSIEPLVSLRKTTLRGEIVDAKCFLGVMKPGNLKTHRSCAVSCIRGGIPPVLLVRNREGLARYFILAGRDGRPLNHEVLHLIAEPVEITGDIVFLGPVAMLHTEPNEIIPE